MLIGIFSFAFVYFNQLTLTQAVGSAAQYLQNNRMNLTDPCASALSALKGSAPSLTPAKISLTLNINGTQASGSTCATDLSIFENAASAPVTVSATYPCDFILLNGAVGLLKTTFSTSCQLSAQVTEYEY
jgi:hypothetical protein